MMIMIMIIILIINDIFKSVTEHEDVTVYGIKGYKRIERFWQTGLT
jgi:hypothetical protein